SMRQVACLCLTLICAGCASVNGSAEDCATDRDCKGARICDAQMRVCVDPGPGDGGGLPGCPGPVTGPHYKYAASALRLPGSAMGYALDIDGDQRPDNQLKALVAALTAAGFDLQGPIDKSVQNGEVVILLDLQAADLGSGCANLTLS